MTENKNETVETPAMVSDLNLLDDDARMAHNFASKAVREAEAALTGAESEAETLARIFADAEDKARKSEILALVKTARESVPSEDEVKAILAKARKRYDAAVLAWDSEETPENFYFPKFPGKAKSGSGTGRGAGVPRPRGLQAILKGTHETRKNADGVEVPHTSSTLAQKIGDGLTTAAILDAWKSVAGEDSESWQEGQTATVEVTGKSGDKYPITFTYKSA